MPFGNSFRRIPTGFCLKAQGCEERATLGHPASGNNPNGVAATACVRRRHPIEVAGPNRRSQPRWGCAWADCIPRVARSSQPWAELHNPVGIGELVGAADFPPRSCGEELPKGIRLKPAFRVRLGIRRGPGAKALCELMLAKKKDRS